ncbi:MAG TPA: tetratricopeptide repeat protein, partial [Anaeromyxobacteraceae bacterium]|nr:tetratricopeptide repeat protein [Anaeromyxobacteraceae bacterium]
VEQGVAQLRTAPPARGLAKAPRPPQAAAVATREKQEVAEPPPEPSGVFALAREQEAKGQKEVARDLYREYVEKFPRDPNAAHAHYRLGELAYGDHKYPEAIVEYGKVAQDFPHAEEAPDALYRTAESMLAIDLRDDAMVVLSEIPTRYPTSAAAARAKERLADLKGGGGAKKK